MRQPILDPQTIAEYRRDGAVCLRGIFDADWRDALAQDIEQDKTAPGPLAKDRTGAGGGLYFVDFQLWRRWPNCRRFIFDSPAAGIAAQLMGSDTVVFYHDHLLLKERETGAPTPWHHDQPYYPVDGTQILSIWLPLDPVPKAAAMEFIAGSHLWGRWFQPKFFDAKATRLAGLPEGFEEMPDFDAERANYQILSWEMQPGDAICFHGLTVHGAPGNLSPINRRRAWATRWLGDDTRFAARAGEISPNLTGHGLKPGDPMPCEMFPQVWPSAG